LADLLADGPAARLLLATGAPSAGVERLLKHVAYAGPTAADAEAGFLIARDLSDERSEVTAGLLQALRGGDVKLRAAAAITAGNLGRADAAVVEELAKLLATDPGTVRAATEALSEIAKADRAAAHRLLAVSRSDPHAFMMATLALSASGRHEPDVRAALAERVRESDPSAAIAAAMGLAEQGVDAPGAADALVSVLKGQYFEFCRPDCAAALLGKLGNSRPEVVAALFAAANGNDRTAVVAAADALRRLGKANRALIAPLITALRSSPPETAAADTLRRLGYGTPEVVHALALTIATFGPPAVVFRALGELGGSQPRAVSALMEVLESDDPGTPAAAAAALERLRQTAPDTVQRAEEDLLRTVNDPDQTDPAAQAAAIKLAWLGRADDAVIGRLIEALSAEYGQLNEPAARALGRLGKPEPRVIQALRASLARGGAPRAVTDALGILGQPDPQVIALLVKDLRDASRADAAATALARLGDASPEVIRGLQTALRYNLFFTAEDASSALGTLGQRRADWTDDYLLGLLAHHESAWRTTAAAVIAAREPLDGKLLERVVALRKDARPWVRLAAWDTQSRIEARNQRAAAAAPVDDK
jgi:hypothetical protein